MSAATLSPHSVSKAVPQPKFTSEFERVILPHLNPAYNLARWLLGSEQDACDVVHDSFLRAHRYFDSFNGSDGRAWLLGIVRNNCFNFLRARKVQPFNGKTDIDQEIAADPNPERQAILDQDLSALRRCIEALPAEYREVLVLREMDELSYSEISATAGLPIGTVMSRLNRARTRLENCVTGKGKEVRQ